MPSKMQQLLEQRNIRSRDKHSLRQVVTTLSLVVITVVFWSLKLTGIGIAGEAFCGMQEHVHGEECQTKTLICALEEIESHIHSESCFSRELICELEENDEHTHEESCWNVVSACAQEETEGHIHTEECYEIAKNCPQEEHIHIESCYSDITADLETCDDWETSLADMVKGPTTRENVILVAKSQLGYTESTRNYQVDADGIRRGITRYGQWYGNPYGNWSAMFASFCLSYAGVEDAPVNAGAESMRLEWEAAGMYRSAVDALPEVGNLVFLYHNSKAHSVAIITAVDETAITVIEGDLDDAVAEVQYAADDPSILGYGLVPSRERLAMLSSTDVIAKTTTYSQNIFSGNRLFIVYTTRNSLHYAFDGNGNAVPISIDANGNIYTDSSDSDALFWTFTASGTNTYLIRNVSTGRYMHSYPENGSGVTTVGAYTSKTVASGSGAKIQSNNVYSKLNSDLSAFQMTQNSAEGAVFSFGVAEGCTVWLDGTDGGLGHLTGSPDTGYTAYVGRTLKLPEQWTSPSKYSYKLRGWYDVTNARYYLPGEEMTVTGNAVLYADWVASTYDVGQFNAHVTDSISTASFITTHVFDYNYLFNIYSAQAQITVDANGHSEQWSMVTSGNVAYGNQTTSDFIFVDNDAEGLLCIPYDRSAQNIYHGEGIVTQGAYSAQLKNLLFSTSDGGDYVVGKTYLGTGDYLYQMMDDPTDEHYGYYYYDSARNAASYNQSNGRFYVYEYLSATSDSVGSSYSDFLPLNSPYANTNGKTIGTYNYAGVDGEYSGIPHFRYDSKYDSGDYNSANNVQTNYAYGLRSEIRFYLPNDPGEGGNLDLHGNDMQFQFSGDDDLWVLIDGVLVLDIGGIHGAESGLIDFSTGEITVQGVQQASLMDLGVTAGDHTMTVLYLERGSSKSNCSIYFNLAPRFSLQIQKEDVLTQALLDGAVFTVYKDLECTVPAELWASVNDYNADLSDGVIDQYQNSFTVQDGVATLWGLGSGNTYYIKETSPPGKEGYGLPDGVIRLKIEREGYSTYLAEIIPDADGNGPSNGYTLHGVRIDEHTKTVYITVTNAPQTVTETTTVQVIKKWEDTLDHSNDYIQAYLTVTDSDGTVRRIREVTLGDENDWMYLWTNLPKYDYDTMAEVQYGIEESYESGYYSTVRKITEIVITKTQWAEALTFQNGETYILRSASGYLSTLDNREDTGYMWVDEQTAKSSPNALWTATVNNGKVKFTNGLSQTITFYYNGGSPTDFYARVPAPSSNDRQEFSYSNRSNGLQIFYQQGWNYYYLTGSMNGSQKFGYSTDANQSLILNPVRKITQNEIREVEDWAYQITNKPLAADNETSFSVSKVWDIPEGCDASLYQEFAVTVRLLANGVSTGRSITLNLKNNWKGSFQGLPYRDDSGNVIRYSVEEVWQKSMWTSHYGPIQVSDGAPPTYSTTITNTYHPGGPELPSTGSPARLMYILCGSGILLGSLVYGIGTRRKRERRME